MGQLLARCGHCDGTRFEPANPMQPVKLTSELVCCACGERAVHGNLIAQLAKDAVHQSRAYTAARVKRQTALVEMSPKLRARKGTAAAELPAKSDAPDDSDR